MWATTRPNWIPSDSSSSACGDRVVHRLGGRSLVPVPSRGASVKGRCEARLSQLQLVPEELGEQAVIAVPLAFRVERDEEEVRALDVLEDRCRALAVDDRVAKRTAEALEDRRAQEEVPDLLGLAVEHLRAEVVDDVTLVARKRLDEGPRVGSPAQRESSEIQACGPTLRPLVQPRHVFWIEAQLEHTVQEHGGLLVGEAQLLRSDLVQLTAGAQPRKRQWRIAASAEDDVQRRRQVLEQELNSGVN